MSEMKHSQGTLEVIVRVDGEHPEHHCQLVMPVLNGKRSGVVADTLNCDHIFDLDEQRANAERLAECWNCHDELVAALRLVLAEWKSIDPDQVVPDEINNDSTWEAIESILAKAK